MPTYRIADWKEHFENHRTRELQKLDWVLIPNKMDGLGYAELVSHPNGAAHFGAWIAIVEIASRQKQRGTLPTLRGSTAVALAKLSRLPENLFEEVLARLVSADIGWLEEVEEEAETQCPDRAESRSSGAMSRDVDTESRKCRAGDRTEQNGEEENRQTRVCATALVPTIPFPLGIEGWDELVEIASKAQMSMDPSPTSDLCQSFWRKLSFSERRDRIKGIVDRIACGQYSDPRYVPTLENYLRVKFRESMRPRAPAAVSKGPVSAGIERGLQRILREASGAS